MDEGGPGLLAQLGGVSRALCVHAHRELERRIEGDQAGAVDHASELAVELADLLSGEAEHRIGHVARERHAFVPQERIEPVSVALAQGPEGRRGSHLVEEPIVSGPAGSRADEHVDLSHPGVAVEQHRQRDLAEEAGDAGDEDLVAAEGPVEIDAQGSSFAAITGLSSARISSG